MINKIVAENIGLFCQETTVKHIFFIDLRVYNTRLGYEFRL